MACSCQLWWPKIVFCSLVILSGVVQRQYSFTAFPLHISISSLSILDHLCFMLISFLKSAFLALGQVQVCLCTCTHSHTHTRIHQIRFFQSTSAFRLPQVLGFNSNKDTQRAMSAGPQLIIWRTGTPFRQLSFSTSDIASGIEVWSDLSLCLRKDPTGSVSHLPNRTPHRPTYFIAFELGNWLLPWFKARPLCTRTSYLWLLCLKGVLARVPVSSSVHPSL